MQPGTIDKMEILPLPILMKYEEEHNGSSIAASILTQFTLNETILTGAKVRIEAVFPGLITLPIYNEEFLLDDILEMYSDTCPDHVPSGQTCATPLLPGVYGGPPLQDFPALPDDLEKGLRLWFLLNGRQAFEVVTKATILLEDDTEMTCIYVRTFVEVEIPDPTVSPLRTTKTSTTTPATTSSKVNIQISYLVLLFCLFLSQKAVTKVF